MLVIQVIFRPAEWHVLHIRCNTEQNIVFEVKHGLLMQHNCPMQENQLGTNSPIGSMMNILWSDCPVVKTQLALAVVKLLDANYGWKKNSQTQLVFLRHFSENRSANCPFMDWGLYPLEKFSESVTKQNSGSSSAHHSSHLCPEVSSTVKGLFTLTLSCIFQTCRRFF